MNRDQPRRGKRAWLASIACLLNHQMKNISWQGQDWNASYHFTNSSPSPSLSFSLLHIATATCHRATSATAVTVAPSPPFAVADPRQTSRRPTVFPGARRREKWQCLMTCQCEPGVSFALKEESCARSLTGACQPVLSTGVWSPVTAQHYPPHCDICVGK